MTVMHKTFAPLLLCSALFFQGCGQSEQAVRSVQEFLDNPAFLEAAMVRCAQNRAETRYDAECMNARQAVSIIEAREERARRDQLESESESKRDALRRTQRAAAEARRRAAEQEQLRKEAEYLAQFGELPKVPNDGADEPLKANVPGAVIPATTSPPRSSAPSTGEETPPVIFDEPVRQAQESVPASDGGNAPASQNNTEPTLDAVREELRRRQEASTD
jgi:hypothetical protein